MKVVGSSVTLNKGLFDIQFILLQLFLPSAASHPQMGGLLSFRLSTISGKIDKARKQEEKVWRSNNSADKIELPKF